MSVVAPGAGDGLAGMPGVEAADAVAAAPPVVVGAAQPRVAASPRFRPARRFAPSMAVAADLVALTVVVLLTSSRTLGVLLIVGSYLAARVAMRAYRPRLNLSALDDVPRTLAAGLVCLGAVFGVRLVVFDGRGVAAHTVAQVSLIMVLSTISTAIAFAVAREVRRRRADILPIALVVGPANVGDALVEAFDRHPEYGLRPVRLRADVTDSEEDADRDPSQLVQAIEQSGAEVVVLAFSGAGEQATDSLITVHRTDRRLFVVPAVAELHHDGADVERIRGIPIIRVRPNPNVRLGWAVKRIADVVLASLALVLCAPVLAVVALAILIESGRPVLFRQQRVGCDGRTFELLKFRTLLPASERESDTTWNIGEDPRLTRLGRLLRRTSLDEIPQLWNIARGEMSIVGPRPERPAFVAMFSVEHERYWARHRVPAGLTGLAQVNGLRGDTSIRERARYDNYYIANWSLWLDIKIVMLTVREVLGGRGR